MPPGLKASVVAKLLRRGSFDLVLQDGDTLVLVSEGAPKQKIPLADTVRISLEEGALWNSIAITPKNGRSFAVGGFPKAASRSFFDVAEKAFARHYYAHSYKEAKAVLSQYPSKDTYFRLEQFEQLCRTAKGKMPDYSFLRQMPAEAVQKEALLTIESLLKGERSLRERHNAGFIARELERYRNYFDTVEKNPLTPKQREAVVVNEKANLVVAGAGSGKTSVMVARVGYVLQRYGLRPEEILVLAFNKTAAAELQERIGARLNIEGVKASTFHALGLEVISMVEKAKPSVAGWASSEREKAKRIEGLIRGLAKEDGGFEETLMLFFAKPFAAYKSAFEFDSGVAYRRYIKDEKIVTLNGEEVKSYEECEIANFLILNGISYVYEASYEHNTATMEHAQYRPDFYLPDYGIYLEHFGIDEHGNTAPYIPRQPYLEGMVWKRALHRHYGTRMLETYSYQKRKGCLLSKLREQLSEAGVAFKPVSLEDVISHLNDTGVFNSFAGTIGAFISHFKSNGHTMQILRERAGGDERILAFLELFEPILARYEAMKQKEGVVDFEDMIEQATRYIENGRYHSPYRCILVDEFQDISTARAKLVRALHRQDGDRVLTAVGDDWQSIYRFTGSDISLFHGFGRFFGDSERVSLDYTFRFNDKISEASRRFIEANPNQIKKRIRTVEQASEPKVHLWWGDDKDMGRIDNLLKRIGEREAGVRPSVFILGRTRFAFPTDIASIKRRHPGVEITLLTAHASKGLEADYVILAGVASGRFGFPSTVEDDPILDIALAEREEFEHAEERRLFYVAMTRAKKEVHVLASNVNVSPFARELSKYEDEVVNHYENGIKPQPCPSCKSGVLVVRTGPDKKRFFGCSNYAAECSYTEKLHTCPKCHTGIMQRSGLENYRCSECEYILPACSDCKSMMVVRQNKKSGQLFYGCSQYPHCKNTARYVSV